MGPDHPLTPDTTTKAASAVETKPDAIDPARAELMRRVRSEGTDVESLLARALRRRRVSFRRGDELPGKPDVVLPSKKIAVFVDGDLWHGAQWRRRGHDQVEDQFRNAERAGYWAKKIRGNVDRDLRRTHELVGRGWRVLRFWGSEIERDVDAAAETVVAARDGALAPNATATRVSGRVALEFFAGIGLMRQGLERTGWRVAWANDNDPAKRRFYDGRFEPRDGHAFVERDVRGVAPEEMPDASLATASFPCTDLSLAGRGKGIREGAQSSAFLAFADLMHRLGDRRPPLIMLENVPALLSSHSGHDMRLCLDALAELGMTVDAFVLDARHFVPQSRPRLFVVAIDKALAVDDGVWTDEPLGALRPERLARFIESNADLPWRLRRLPAPPAGAKPLEDVLVHPPEDDPSWWSEQRAAKLLGQMSERHRAIADSMIAAERESAGCVFRRMRKGRSTAELRTDGLAGCLRTPRGGSARQILFVAGGGRYRVRLVSPIECSRLMGADDEAIPEGVSVTQALFGYGDAVCVPAVEWIADRYLNAIASAAIRGPLLGTS